MGVWVRGVWWIDGARRPGWDGGGRVTPGGGAGGTERVMVGLVKRGGGHAVVHVVRGVVICAGQAVRGAVRAPNM